MAVDEHDLREPFDVLVIGGGCVGTSVAMFAARAGLQTALVEADDFGSKTTAASTELIHGGLQYLFRLKLGIVRQSNEYARRIFRSASHLCHPLPIVVPSYRGGPVPLTAMRLFMRLYERYNRRLRQAPPMRKLSAQEIVELVPGIRREGLLGGVEYYEWQVDSPRLCLATAQAAAEQGAWVRNHARVTAITRQEDGSFRVEVDDTRSAEPQTLAARVVVNATGPWTDELCRMAGIEDRQRIRPTRGAHVFVPKIAEVGILEHLIDGRFAIIVPRGHLSMIGTTDDDYYGDLDNMQATDDEVAYLMQGAKHLLPGLDTTAVVDTKVGVRPTIFQYGKTEDKVSRDHRIDEHDDAQMANFISVYGGKLATHTLMAEDVLTLVARRLDRPFIAPTEYRLPGAPDTEPEALFAAAREAAAEYDLDPQAMETLARRYGTNYPAVAELAANDPALKQNLCQCKLAGQTANYVLAAEVEYALQNEWALTTEDLARRTGMHVGSCRTSGCIDRLEQFVSNAAPRAGQHAGAYQSASATQPDEKR